MSVHPETNGTAVVEITADLPNEQRTASRKSVLSVNNAPEKVPCGTVKCWTLTGVSIVGILLIAAVIVVYATADPKPETDKGNSTSSSGSSSAATGGSACFAAGTLIETSNGGLRRIEEVQIGDSLALGGRVNAKMEFEIKREQLFQYWVGNTTHHQSTASAAVPLQIIVAGSHAVFERDGVWRRVFEAEHSSPIDEMTWLSLLPTTGMDKARVYDLDTKHHRILVRAMPGAPGIVFSDFSEVDANHPLVKRFEQALIENFRATSERSTAAFEV